MLGGKLQGRWKSTFVVVLSTLALSLTASTAQAADANLTSFSATAANSSPSASTTYTLTLVTNATLAANTEIIFSMGASAGSVGVSSSTITSTMTGTGSTFSTGDQTFLKFALSAQALAGSHTISVATVTNPSVASTVTINLSTTGFSGFMSGNLASATVTISTGSDGGDGGSSDGEEGGGEEGDFGGGDSEEFGRETGENTITVTVLDENGAGIASQSVIGYCGMSYDEATTSAGGIVTLEGLTSGSCGVELSTAGGYYADRSYFTFAQSDSAQTQAVELTGLILDTSVAFTIIDSEGAAAAQVYLSVVDASGRRFENPTDENGEVTIPLDYGTYSVTGYLDESTYFFPDTQITVSEDVSSQSVSIQLEAFTSFIQGTVTDAAGTAIASPNMLIISEEGDIRFTMGDEEGTFNLGVAPGVYTIKAEKSGYANGAIQDITISADQTETDQNIALDTAENTLNLAVVDESGAANTDIMGGIMCKDPEGFDPISVYFAFMTGGTATFYLPDSTVQCSLFTTGYATDSPTFSLLGGETESGEITLISYDSNLLISLVDENGNAVNAVSFGVFGQTDDSGRTLNGFSMGGQTTIGAAAGTYTLRTFVMSGEYTTDFTNPTVVTLVAGADTTATITVYERGGSLSGTITDDAGDPVVGAAVTAKSENDSTPFSFSTVTDEEGNYSMDIVPATYSITGAKGESDTATAAVAGASRSAAEDSTNLPATVVGVEVTAGEETTTDLSLEKTNATLTLIPVESAEGDIESGSCYAFEANGTYVNVELSEGTATLGVNPGEWHYGCRALVGSSEYTTKSEGVITIVKNDAKTAETILTEAGTGFHNVVYQFSATADATLTLPDDTTLFVPANALDTSGNVSITASSASVVGVDEDAYPVLPISLKARDSNGAVITGTFNGQVTITFNYTQQHLNQHGVNEGDLEGQSFKNGLWSTTDQGFTVKQGSDYVSITTDHFSTFGLVAPLHIPKKVRALDAKKITNASAKLSWTAPKASKVETYTVQVRPFKSTKKSTWMKLTDLTGTSKKIKGLDSGVKYQMRTKACNAQGCGSFTDWESFTTKAGTAG